MIPSSPFFFKSKNVVIGSGPGGSMTAFTLTEHNQETLLIDEGSFLSQNSCEHFSLEEMSQKYRNRGLLSTLGRNSIIYAEGKCVGGGSEINAGLYHRLPEKILEKWKESHDFQDCSWGELVPHFKTIEKLFSVSMSPEEVPLLGKKLQRGANAFNWKVEEIPRFFKYSSKTYDSGKRQSVTEVLIPKIQSQGGQILPETKIEEIHERNGTWILKGVQHSKFPVEVHAERLFLAGGAIATPALLRKSGIKRNIGNSLEMHPTLKIIARFPEAINTKTTDIAPIQVQEFSPKLLLGCSISTLPHLAMGLVDQPEKVAQLEKEWSFYGIYYACISPKAQGKVRVPFGTIPWVFYNLTSEDKALLQRGLESLSQLLFEAGAEKLYANSGEEIDSEKNVSTILSRMMQEETYQLMTVHLFSSCPMGENISNCAVDSFGKIHGLKNIFIADGSLLCSAPGVNPEGTILALTRRNALHSIKP